MVKIGPLAADQRQALERLRRRAVGRVSQRAHMILLSAQGYTVPQLAEIFDVGEDVVRTWLHRYQQAGCVGLDDRPRPGRPPRARLARQIVDTQASNPPHNSGLVQSCWTAGLLAAFLAARFGLVLSHGSVRRHLHASGWRWEIRIFMSTSWAGFELTSQRQIWQLQRRSRPACASARSIQSLR